MPGSGPYHCATGLSSWQEGSMGPRIEHSTALDSFPTLVFLSFEMGSSFSTAASPKFSRAKALARFSRYKAAQEAARKKIRLKSRQKLIKALMTPLTWRAAVPRSRGSNEIPPTLDTLLVPTAQNL